MPNTAASSEMNVFVAAVDAGGFSAAARLLDLTPSAVSKQISRLEERLGARLLNRSTRRISLTDAAGNSMKDPVRSSRISTRRNAPLAVYPRSRAVNCG